MELLEAGRCAACRAPATTRDKGDGQFYCGACFAEWELDQMDAEVAAAEAHKRATWVANPARVYASGPRTTDLAVSETLMVDKVSALSSNQASMMKSLRAKHDVSITVTSAADDWPALIVVTEAFVAQCDEFDKFGVVVELMIQSCPPSSRQYQLLQRLLGQIETLRRQFAQVKVQATHGATRIDLWTQQHEPFPPRGPLKTVGVIDSWGAVAAAAVKCPTYTEFIETLALEPGSPLQLKPVAVSLPLTPLLGRMLVAEGSLNQPLVIILAAQTLHQIGTPGCLGTRSAQQYAKHRLATSWIPLMHRCSETDWSAVCFPGDAPTGIPYLSLLRQCLAECIAMGELTKRRIVFVVTQWWSDDVAKLLTGLLCEQLSHLVRVAPDVDVSSVSDVLIKVVDELREAALRVAIPPSTKTEDDIE